MPPTRRIFWIFIALAAATVSIVTACTSSRANVVAKADRDALKQAVQSIGVYSFGEVILDRSYGKRSISSDPPGRAVNVLMPTGETASQQRVAAALALAGFHQSAADLWERRSGTRLTRVYVTAHPSGYRIESRDGYVLVPSEETGVALNFVTGG